ncbi:MAG: hypothetical protein KJS95_09995 [Gammaproteobacteria bacterium]|nr:hypothetical protein [Gammaproteobacteria bacterium]
MANDVAVQLDELEQLILAALDELRTPDESGVTQVVVLRELRMAIESLERHGDANPESRQRIRDAREMYERLAEVSSLSRVVSGMRTPLPQVSDRRH